MCQNNIKLELEHVESRDYGLMGTWREREGWIKFHAVYAMRFERLKKLGRWKHVHEREREEGKLTRRIRLRIRERKGFR
jgi:hypothetical protein